jgi:O-antigen ligase
MILRIVALTGGAIAAYGLWVYASGNQAVMWRPKTSYLDRLTATFINPDNFAAYAGLILVCMLGLLADAWPRRGTRPAGHRIGPGAVLFHAALAVGLLIDCAVLALSASRAGVAAALLGVGVLSVLLLARLPKGGRLLLLLVLMTLGFAFVLCEARLGSHLGVRFQQLGPDFRGRLELDAHVLAAIRRAPWLGSGFGAFEPAFAMFRDASLPQYTRIEYAHNDWLEALMTLGVPVGLLLWLVFGWMLVRCCIGALRGGRGPVHAAVAAGCWVLATFHSLFEFNLQIQGFTLPLLTVLGVGIAQSWAGEADRSD